MRIASLRRLMAAASTVFLLQNVSAKTISDSLVNNLDCGNAKIENILTHIKPSAFSAANHMPMKNWAFKSGAVPLAACWGMGSTQRKWFYLLRLGENSAKDFDTKTVLDMIRGVSVNNYLLQKTEVAADDGTNIQRLSESKLKDYSVIPLNEKTIASEWGRNNGLSFLDKITKGLDYKIGYDNVHRDFKTEVERSQELHFFRARNIGMGTGSGPRSTKDDAETVQLLMKNLSMNRLSLVNLRLRMNVQHVVIPKSFSKDEKGNVWFKAYDSNQPDRDQMIYFSKDAGHFYSPQIMGPFDGDYSGTDYTKPLGTFVVDEDERGLIENALVKYYGAVCRN